MRSLDVDEVTAAARGTEAAFAVGTHLGVVVHMHRPADPPGELLPRVEAGPGGVVAQWAGPSRGQVERAGDTRRDAEDVGHRQVVVADETLDKLRCGVQGGAGSIIDVERLALFGEHLTVGPRDGDRDVRVTDIDANHHASGCRRHEQGRGASAGAVRAARIAALLDDQPGCQEVLDPLCDGASR